MSGSGITKDFPITGSAKLSSLRMGTVSTLRAAVTLTPEDSGNTFIVNGATAAFTITLPSATEMIGCSFTFLVLDATNAVTIDSPTDDVINGVIHNNGAVDPISDTDIVTITTGAVKGDYVKLRGLSAAYIHLEAACSGSGGITSSG